MTSCVPARRVAGISPLIINVSGVRAWVSDMGNRFLLMAFTHTHTHTLHLYMRDSRRIQVDSPSPNQFDFQHYLDLASLESDQRT